MISGQTPRRRGFSAVDAPLLPLLAVAALIGVAPFLAALRGSFLHDVYGDISPAGLENYRFILADRAFGFSLAITVLWAFLQTLLTLSIGFVLAYRLWRSGTRGRLLYTAVLIPWGVPVYIAVPLWRALIHGDGVPFNLLIQPATAFVSALLVSIWLTLPATIFLLHGAFKKTGRHVLEAAVIDGADEGTIALSICFPAVREMVLSVALLTFVKSLKEFTVVFLMTAGGPPLVSGITDRYIVGATTTLSLFLYDLFLSSSDYGVSSAFSVLLSLVVITATLLYLIVRSGKAGTWRRALPLFPLVSQLLTGSNLALPVALLYAAVLMFPRKLPAAVLVHAGAMMYSLARAGFPAGLQPAFFIALAVLAVSREDGRQGSVRAGFRFPWNALERMLTGLFIAASALLLLALVWLSFSGIDAVAFDSLLPPYPGIRAYVKAVTEERIQLYFLNSLLLASATALLLPLFTFPAAWALVSGSGRRESMVLGNLQLIGTVSGMHALIPLYIIFRFLGMINSYTSLVLIYLEHGFIFSLFTMTAFLRRMPSSLREAALLEGAGTVVYLRRVLLPLSRPVVFTSMVVAFLGAWNGFLPTLLFIRDDARYTIGVKIFSFVGSIASGSPRWSMFAAASVINLLILTLLFAAAGKPGGKSALEDLDG